MISFRSRPWTGGAIAPRRILIVRLSALGDVANCLPAIHALQQLFPEARIDAVSESMGAAILSTQKDLQQILILPRKRWEKSLCKPGLWPELLLEFVRFVFTLRRSRYDLLVDFQGNLRSLMVRALARTSITFTHHPGELRESALGFAYHPPLPSGPVRRAEKHLHLVRTIKDAPLHLPENYFPLPLSPAPRRKPVLIHPFASGVARLKRWPMASWVELGKLMQQKSSEFWISRGPGEEEEARLLAEAFSPPAPILEHPGGIAELASRLQSFSLVIAGDTGPLHLAALGGVPVLGLYGPKDPAIYAPWGAQGSVLRAGVPCSPCTLRVCEHSVCMSLITPGQVFREVLRRQGNPTTLPTRI